MISGSKKYHHGKSEFSILINFNLRKNLELEEIILHEDYNSATTEHDIALLKLKEPLDLSVRLEHLACIPLGWFSITKWTHQVYTPACLPESGVDFTGETAWVYGWGTTEMGGDIEDTLRFLSHAPVASWG